MADEIELDENDETILDAVWDKLGGKKAAKRRESINSMATALHVGARGDQTITVTDDLTAVAMGSGSLPVLSTPAMIALMESAALAAIDSLLPEGQSSVGIEINVRHLSATPVGEEIIASAIVTQIDGKRITFEVRAWDRRELIGEGTHVRYIIDELRFMSRLGSDD